MCLIAVAWQAHPRYRLALIANRDEFHDRPAAPAAHDPHRPDIYGGRDLQAGGSWLLASTRGRLAAVTNVRAGLQGEAAPRWARCVQPQQRRPVVKLAEQPRPPVG
jgi:uncharacterized protein with NRDE domain